MRLRSILALLLALMAATPASAQALPYSLIDADAYQSFVRNWEPPSQPLCAAMQTPADWDAVMGPAATMRQSKPFAPPADVWSRNAILLVARVVDAGNPTKVFRLRAVRRTGDSLEVEYGFAPPPKASSAMKSWLAVKVAKPLPPAIRFVEGGRVVCRLAPTSGTWRTIGAP